MTYQFSDSSTLFIMYKEENSGYLSFLPAVPGLALSLEFGPPRELLEL